TQMISPWAEWDAEVGLSDRRQIEVRPALLFQQMADRIVQVKALHNHDDGVLGLVIETAEQRVGVPLLGIFAGSFRIGVLRLERVINDDEVAAAAGEGRSRSRAGSLRGWSQTPIRCLWHC